MSPGATSWVRLPSAYDKVFVPQLATWLLDLATGWRSVLIGYPWRIVFNFGIAFIDRLWRARRDIRTGHLTDRIAKEANAKETRRLNAEHATLLA